VGFFFGRGFPGLPGLRKSHSRHKIPSHDGIFYWENPQIAQISQIYIKLKSYPLIYANPREILMPFGLIAFY